MDTAQYITENKDSLLAAWEEAARREVVAAREADSLALRDHFPRVLEDIRRALELIEEVGEGRAAADRAFDEANSSQHGRHRAAIDGYTAQQVMQEFFILRYVLTQALQREGIASRQEMEAMTRILELGALRSVAEFVKSIEEVQQRMAGMLAHDIRTPLTTVKSGLSLLQNKRTTPETSDEIYQMAMQGVDRALDMLGGLLDTIAAEAGDGIFFHFEEADFAAEIDEACKEAKRTYSRRLQSACPKTPIYGVFDPAALRRLFENLVSNAVRHGKHDGSVEIGLRDEGENIVLSVTNAGEPIAKERQDEIFEFLASSHARRRRDRGWGMGLAFVKLAVEGHRGSVRFESDEESTTFYVNLPKFSRKPGKERVRLVKEP